jgi:hypothetical protein
LTTLRLNVMTYLRLLAGFLERERLPGYLLYKLSNIYLNIFISKLMKSKTLKIHSKRQMPGIVKGKVWPPEGIVSTWKEVPQGLDRARAGRVGYHVQATTLRPQGTKILCPTTSTNPVAKYLHF